MAELIQARFLAALHPFSTTTMNKFGGTARSTCRTACNGRFLASFLVSLGQPVPQPWFRRYT